MFGEPGTDMERLEREGIITMPTLPRKLSWRSASGREEGASRKLRYSVGTKERVPTYLIDSPVRDVTSL